MLRHGHGAVDDLVHDLTCSNGKSDSGECKTRIKMWCQPKQFNLPLKSTFHCVKCVQQ